MVDDLLPFKLACAVLAMCFVAAVRFDRPSWCRSCTTYSKYAVAMASYVLMQALVMMLLYWATRKIIVLSGTEGYLGGLIRPSTPVWGALGLTLLIFSIPALEQWPRNKLQDLAGVPQEALQVARQLNDSNLSVSRTIGDKARYILRSRGIEAGGDWLEIAIPIRKLMFDIAAISVQLRAWERNRKFRRFFEDAYNENCMFRDRFDWLTLRVSRVFAQIESLGQIKSNLTVLHDERGNPEQRHPQEEVYEEIDSLILKSVHNMLAELCTDASTLKTDGCTLVARGLLSVGRTASERNRLASDLGFRIKSAGSRLPYQVFLVAGLFLYLSILAFFLLIGGGRTSVLELPGLVFVIALTQLCAIAVAAIPKTLWGFANSGLDGRTPVGFVLGAGGVALVIAVAINLAAGAIAAGGWAGARSRLEEATPYLCSPFATAAMTAWLVQDHRWCSTKAVKGHRLFDALAMGSMWVVVSLLGRYLKALMEGQNFSAHNISMATTAALVMGFVIGYYFINPFRLASAEQCHSYEPHLGNRWKNGAVAAPMSSSRGESHAHVPASVDLQE